MSLCYYFVKTPILFILLLITFKNRFLWNFLSHIHIYSIQRLTFLDFFLNNYYF